MATSTHFRPRPIDINKPLAIIDHAVDDECVRGVPNMPTGMEPEEEEESHIQYAIAASLAFNTSNLPEIPTPVVKVVQGYDEEMDPHPLNVPQTYLHYRDKTHHEWDQVVEYDMDTEDESFLSNLNSGKAAALSEEKFEFIIDRFEKEYEYHGNDFNLSRAEAALKSVKPNAVIPTVFEYWRKKRQYRQGKTLLPRFVKPPAWDDPSPYVAFRPREKDKEKLKKVRRNDATSLAKMRALRLEMERSRTLLEMIKKRERLKRDHLTVVVDIYNQLQTEMKVEEAEARVPPLKKAKKDAATPAVVPSVKAMPPPAARPRPEHYYTYLTNSTRLKINPQACPPPYILDPPEVRKANLRAQQLQVQQQQAANALLIAPPPKHFLHIPLDFGEDDDYVDESEEDEESEVEEEESDEDLDAADLTAEVNSIAEQLDQHAYFPRKIDGHVVLRRPNPALPNNVRPFRGRARLGRGGRIVFDRSFMFGSLPYEEEAERKRKQHLWEARKNHHLYNHRHYLHHQQQPQPLQDQPLPEQEQHFQPLTNNDVGGEDTQMSEASNSDDVMNTNMDSYDSNDAEIGLSDNFSSQLSEVVDENSNISNNTEDDSNNNMESGGGSSFLAQTSLLPSSSPPVNGNEDMDIKSRDVSSQLDDSNIYLNSNSNTPKSPLTTTPNNNNTHDDVNGAYDAENSSDTTTPCIEKLPPVTFTYTKKQKRKIDTTPVM